MFQEGQQVNLRSLRWKIVSVSDAGVHYVLKLEGVDEANKGMQIAVLSSEDIEKPEVIEVDKLYLGNIIQPLSSWKTFMSAIKLSLHQPYDVFISLLNSKIFIKKYQFVPLVKIMNMVKPRILIADDVGVGKTIEAGIILQELASRNLANRVLIVVPASLQDQWKEEMENKFGLNFQIFDTSNLKNIYKDLVTGENPWEKYNYIITSIDYVKRMDIKRQLIDVYWDVVIIDEAHYLSYVHKKTDRARFGEFIAQRTHTLILLTATPHSGRDESFYSLIKLLEPHLHPNKFKDKKVLRKFFVRRYKKEVFENYAIPNIETIGVKIADGYEREVYDMLKEYTESIWEEAKNYKNSAVGFAMVILKKRLLSSYYSLKKSLETRKKILQEYLNNIKSLEEGEFKLDTEKKKQYIEGISLTEKQKEEFEKTTLEATTAKNRKDLEKEIRTLDNILQKLLTVDLENEMYLKEGDTKARKLLEILKELEVTTGKNKAIVFTEYRDTQDFLVKFLEKNGFEGRIVIMHGGMSRSQRQEAEREFLNDEKWLMVATDAASEGLNFQKKCHIVINYELPWNPNRLLQRIGRVDRVGQKKRVIVKNLYLEKTYEGSILNMLIEKIKNIMESIGNVTDVLGMFDTEKIVETIMEGKDESYKTSLYIFFKELENACQSRTSELFAFVRTSPEEEIENVEKKLGNSFKYLNFLENFVKDSIKKLGGSYEEIGNKIIKFKVPNSLGLKEKDVVGTFDREYAVEHEDIEFITMRHPLVQSILKKYRSMLYDPHEANRVSYVIVPNEKDSVVFFFYAKYADGNNRLAAEKIIPVRVDLDGNIIEWNSEILNKNLKKNLSSEFISALKNKWDKLFDIAQKKSNEIAENMTQEISKEIEKKLEFNLNIVKNYYEREKEAIIREINKRKKELQVQKALFETEKSEEDSRKRDTIRREIKKLETKIDKLSTEMNDKMESIEKMKYVKLAEHGILSALIIRGEIK